MKFEPSAGNEAVSPTVETNQPPPLGTEDPRALEVSAKAQLQASAARLAALNGAFAASDAIDSHITTERKREVPAYPMDRLRELVAKEGGLLLYHGGLADDASLDAIDLQRPGTQQNNRGRQTYGGFYLTDESSRRWSEDYARSRTGNMHGFWIDPSSRVLDAPTKNIDRLSQVQREDYAKEYDVVKGRDTMGRAQYVLLNKGVVKGLGKERL